MDEVSAKLSHKALHILAATTTLARSLRANNPITTQRSSSLDRLAASLATATKSSAPQSSPQTSHRVPLEDVTNSNTSVASWESGSSTAVATPSGDTLFLRDRRSKSDSSIGEGDMRSSKPTILPRISRTGSSPYTYAYESLNGNGGISRTIYAWRRFLIGGTLLIILAWASLGWTGLTGVAIDGMSFSIPAGHCMPYVLQHTAYHEGHVPTAALTFDTCYLMSLTSIIQNDQSIPTLSFRNPSHLPAHCLLSGHPHDPRRTPNHLQYSHSQRIKTLPRLSSAKKHIPHPMARPSQLFNGL
jgi:hypothetical protein